MSYFVFDMDEAIAELYSVFYCITSLRLEESIEGAKMNIPLSDELIKQLYKAYHLFVKKVLHEETSTKPLGILRPGVLHIMKMLQKLKKLKKVAAVIIYSNNGNLQCLEFIRDMIHEYVGSPLITECVHRLHPLREQSTIHYQYNTSGLEKTWGNLRRVLMEGKAKAPTSLKPSDVYFFDDLDHRDLHKGLGTHYYQVPAYRFKASFERVGALYQAAIKEAKVNTISFLSHLSELYGYQNYSASPMSSIRHLTEIFMTSTGQTAIKDELPPPPQYDKGIQMMKEAIQRVEKKKSYQYTKKNK